MAEIWGATLAAVGATVYAANEASNSAEDAAASNAANSRATNELNYKMFRESRGADGSAFLPLYFGDYERQLATDATRAYQAARDASGTPANELAEYRRILAGLRPSIDAGTGAINDIYSGALTNRRLASAQPVMAARTGAARAQKASILDSLLERIGALNADRARQGFVGSGSFDRNRMLQATIGARGAAAETMSRAELENALQQLAIQDAGEAAKLEYLNAPVQRAQQLMELEALPGNQVSRAQATRLGAFQPFWMNPQAFQYQAPPLVQPIPGAGQIAAQGIASGASAAGNYFANQQLVNQLTQQPNLWQTPPAGAGSGSIGVPGRFDFLGSSYGRLGG